MHAIDLPAALLPAEARDSTLALAEAGAGDPARDEQGRIPGVAIGELLALQDQGACPLVSYPGQPGSAALQARSTVELLAAHIGRSVVLMFERGDPLRPVVMGLLQGQAGWSGAQPPAQVECDASGKRLLVRAHKELLLCCGEASISLRADGRVCITGSEILSQARRGHRLRGASIHLN